MILVDRQIGSYDLVDYLPDGSAQLANLVNDGADVAFLGYGPNGANSYPIGIELKALGPTSNDAVESWRSGRLVGGQLPKLCTNFKRAYLIVEGLWRCGLNGEIEIPEWVNTKQRIHSHKWKPLQHAPDYRTFDNFLNSLTEVGHIVVKRTSDRHETARAVMDLYLWWQKDYEAHGSLLQFDKSQEPLGLTRPPFKQRVAAEMDGAGWTKSAAIANFFSSVMEMSNASLTLWEQIPGIGKGLAEKFWLQLRNLKEVPESEKLLKKKRSRA